MSVGVCKIKYATMIKLTQTLIRFGVVGVIKDKIMNAYYVVEYIRRICEH